MLPGQERLTKGSQFEEVFRNGRAYRNRLLVLHVWVRPAAPGQPPRRVGFIVSKKVGGAVVRNYVRRRVSEAYRLSRGRLLAQAVLVWIARPAAASADYHQLAAAVADLLAQANLEQPADPAPARPLPTTN